MIYYWQLLQISLHFSSAQPNVWIGFNSTILKGVKISKGSVIAACSVVTKDVPSNVIVAGNAAKIVFLRYLYEKHC